MISVLGAEKLSLVEIEAFLAASGSVRFSGCGRSEIYGWVDRLHCHHEYPLQGRRSKGLLRAYVECMTGLSRAQSTRLIGGYVRIGRVASKPSARPRYQRHYTSADIELLAAVDEAHERLSGPATRHILKREFEVYGKAEFERLIDAVIKTDTPQGPTWHRFNHDGYGQGRNGAPFTQYGVGRVWPLLTGERGHYELAAGNSTENYIRAVEGLASSTGLLPEQSWDEADRPEIYEWLGKPTGSAMPLMWAHAEYIKLLRSTADGKVYDAIPEVAER